MRNIARAIAPQYARLTLDDMIYKNENEQFHLAEIFRGSDELDTVVEPSLTLARVEQVFAKRTDMLRSLKDDVVTSFYEALSAKVQYEHSYLLEFVAADAQALDRKEKTSKLLHTDYFTLKPLDTRHFLLP